MENPIEKFEVGDYTVKIYPDFNPESPREWDNLGTMICFHSRYRLGDRHDYRPEDYQSWDEIADAVRKEHGPCLIYPLYLYDHSGLAISMSSEPFRMIDSAVWDWGIVGLHYAPYARIRENWGISRVTKKYLDWAVKLLRAEVETYNQYLQNEVYGYVIEGPGTDGEDSCWGFYGLDECVKEARGVAEYLVKDQKERAIQNSKDIKKEMPWPLANEIEALGWCQKYKADITFREEVLIHCAINGIDYAGKARTLLDAVEALLENIQKRAREELADAPA